MNISFMNQLEFTPAYGILCSSLSKKGLRDSLHPTFCKIELGLTTTPHSHFEPEIFFIINGFGQMTIDQESSLVSTGDLISIPAYAIHHLKNMGDKTLEFLSVYSDDLEIPALPDTVLVTAAPPTPNGPLHLGHISGPYLASDVFSRYLRSKSVSVHSHCGTDDHQNYVSEKAHATQTNINAFQKKQRDRILSGLNHSQIQFDEFIQPKSDHEYQFRVLGFTQRAITQGIVRKEQIALPHCHGCDLTLVDALIDGQCPECHLPSRGGCEACGVVVPPYLLDKPHCARCGHAADLKTTEIYTFNLSQYLPLIESYLATLNLSPRLQSLIENVKSKSDFKVMVAHPHNGQPGLALPDSNQNLHVWFEMAAHYESFSLSPSHWVHFFGFDNSFYYLLFIPALLKAMNAQAVLPAAVVTNEFLLLNGLKFSTSRGHAIWADEFTGDTDHLRLYLSLHRPAQFETDFVKSDFDTFSKKLEQSMETLFNRVQRMKRPNPKLTSEKNKLQCHRFIKDLDHMMSIDNLDLRQAAQIATRFIDYSLHSITHSDHDYFYRLQTLASLIGPFMPKSSARLLIALSETQNEPILVAQERIRDL